MPANDFPQLFDKVCTADALWFSLKTYQLHNTGTEQHTGDMLDLLNISIHSALVSAAIKK